MMRSAGWLCAVSVVGFFVFVAFQAGADQLLHNPSFELGDHDVIPGWSKIGTVGEIALSDRHVRTGERSLVFTGVTVSYAGRGVLSGPVPVVEEGEYTFGVWVYLPRVEAEPSNYFVFVQVEWEVQPEEEPRRAPRQGTRLEAFDVWQKLEFSAQSPVGAHSARLRVRVRREAAEVPRADIFLDDAFLCGPVAVVRFVAERFDELSSAEAEELVEHYGERHVWLALSEAVQYSEFMTMVENLYSLQVVGASLVVETETAELVALTKKDESGCRWIGVSSYNTESGAYEVLIDTDGLVAGEYILYIGPSVHTVRLLDAMPECN